ncbi:hypothetical protein RIF29_09072 [Crotalaria pallida]|uniref:Uncharacterized protein n=1 Tax=Crotalaria pallida TaxID=3830 RepID=A0AAN9IHP9_CROPI
MKSVTPMGPRILVASLELFLYNSWKEFTPYPLRMMTWDMTLFVGQDCEMGTSRFEMLINGCAERLRCSSCSLGSDLEVERARERLNTWVVDPNFNYPSNNHVIIRNIANDILITLNNKG